MSNKPRGLGRGLGDLLADNSPEIRASSVIRRDEDGEVSISHTDSGIAGTKAGRIESQTENEVMRTLVFPAVTPMVGGASARAASIESIEKIDEAREILEADAAISGKPLNISDVKNDVETEEKAEEKAEQTVVYPRSLKAIFREFK